MTRLRKISKSPLQVRALVRGRDQAALEAIPQSVAVVKGDIGDYSACLEAMQGCDKVISCVSARSDLTVDLRRVEEQGIQNLARAYMVSCFQRLFHLNVASSFPGAEKMSCSPEGGTPCCSPALANRGPLALGVQQGMRQKI